MQFKNFSARPRALVLAALAFVLFAAAPARAQEEGVATVLDEPVVQVNNDVIMLSHLKRENAEFKEVLTKQRGVRPEEADAQVAQKQTEIIFNLINEALLMQKGKDLPRLSEDIEIEVNREVLRVMNNAGLKTIEQLEAAMRAEGILLSDVKETIRRQYTRQAVLSREVDAKIYYGLTDAELRKYYETNRAQFASLTMSEIFVSLAGRSDAEVAAKAKQLVAQARGGADFGELAAKNSEREQSAVTKGLLADKDGKARWFLVSELNPVVSAAVKDLPVGGVAEPIKIDEGYLILRVNERDDSFKENFVRGQITQDRQDKEREAYLRKLRQEAWIKPAENYKEIIQPLLEKDRQEAEKGKRETANKKNDE